MKRLFTFIFLSTFIFTLFAQQGSRQMRIVTHDGATLHQENGAWIIRLADIDSIDFQFITPTESDTPSEDVKPDEKEHTYVDLGLSSGTLWATCNIGASTPLEAGDLFAWGEIVPKNEYTANTYKWFKQDTVPGYSYTNELGLIVNVPAKVTTYIKKYNNDATCGLDGFTDGKTTLDAEDDAAAVLWGGTWHIPTYEQVRELYDVCTWELQTANTSEGDLVVYYKVIGPNQNCIYFPAVDTYGDYWSASLNTAEPINAHSVGFDIDEQIHYTYDISRSRGQSIRPVCSVAQE